VDLSSEDTREDVSTSGDMWDARNFSVQTFQFLMIRKSGISRDFRSSLSRAARREKERERNKGGHVERGCKITFCMRIAEPQETSIHSSSREGWEESECGGGGGSSHVHASDTRACMRA